MTKMKLTAKEFRYLIDTNKEGWTYHHSLQENPLDGGTIDYAGVKKLISRENYVKEYYFQPVHKIYVVKLKGGEWLQLDKTNQ